MSIKISKVRLLSVALMSGVILSASAMPVSAQSFLDKAKGIFAGGKDDGKAKPHETLEAPFATDGQTTTGDKNSLLFLYDKELTGTQEGNILAKPHRTDAQMAEWVMVVVTNLLSFDYRQSQEHINKYGSLFHRPALAQYVREVNKSGLVKIMKTHGLTSMAMFDELPEVISKGNFKGIYRWSYDFPVKVTFRYLNPSARQDAGTHTVVVQVKMRIGRVPSQKGLDSALIESWSMEIVG